MSLMLLAMLAVDEPAPPARAEVCYAHVMVLIEEAMAETGRVAGPSWFIRDWWGERLGEGADAPARQAAVKAQVVARKTADPAAFREERGGCIDEAIKAGAVPGMGG